MEEKNEPAGWEQRFPHFIAKEAQESLPKVTEPVHGGPGQTSTEPHLSGVSTTSTITKVTDRLNIMCDPGLDSGLGMGMGRGQ